MPTCSEWSGFRLAVANDARNYQIRIVKRCTVRVRKRISKFATFVYRTGRLRRDVAWYPTWKRELFEQSLQPRFVLRHMRIHLAVCALQISIGHHSRPAMSRTRNVQHIQIAFLDHAIQVHVHEVESWCGAPVTKQAWFHIGQRQRRFQQRILQQVDLPNRQIVRRTPPRVHVVQELGRQRHRRRHCHGGFLLEWE